MEEGEGWRVEEIMRALLLRKGKKEVDRREGRGGKGRGRDLPDQCQSASYAPALARVVIITLYVAWRIAGSESCRSSIIINHILIPKNTLQ